MNFNTIKLKVKNKYAAIRPKTCTSSPLVEHTFWFVKIPLTGITDGFSLLLPAIF